MVGFQWVVAITNTPNLVARSPPFYRITCQDPYLAPKISFKGISMHGRVLELGKLAWEQEDVKVNWDPLVICPHTAFITITNLCLIVICLTSAFPTML